TYASWCVLILPFIEQDNLYKQWDITQPYGNQPVGVVQTSVNTFYCPSRRSPPKLSAAGLDTNNPGASGDYAGCGGDRVGYNGELDGNGTTPSPLMANGTMIMASSSISGGVITRWSPLLAISGISDGASNTFLLGERNVPTSKMNINDI